MKKNEKKYPCHLAVTMTLGTPVRSFGRLEQSPGLPLPVAAPQPSHLTEAVKNRHQNCHQLRDQTLLSLNIFSMNPLVDDSNTV